MKAKQYWLDICTPHGDPCDFIHTSNPKLNKHPMISSTNIHVIEYSAYEELKKELVALQKIHQEAWKMMTNRIIEEDERFIDGFRSLLNKKLVKENEELKKRLSDD